MGLSTMLMKCGAVLAWGLGDQKLQRFKKFFDVNYDGSEYDAYEMRGCISMGSGGSKAPVGAGFAAIQRGAGQRGGGRGGVEPPSRAAPVQNGTRTSTVRNGGRMSASGPTRTSISRGNTRSVSASGPTRTSISRGNT